MRTVLQKPLVTIREATYTRLLMILAPLLNFLSGITFDLHAPSLPAMAVYFAAPISSVKNTISVTMFGFAIGCLIFGALLDTIGRRPSIIAGLLLYTLASFTAVFTYHIDQLLCIRFIQGIAVSAMSVGSRALIMDNFTGHEFKVGLLYTSFAFGLGPIIAPFIGGYLQDHLGWQANFVAYGIVSLILLAIFATCVVETKTQPSRFSFFGLLNNYLEVLKNRSFIPGIIIGGISQVQLLTYTTVGAFLVENILHRSATTYGQTALLVSCGYLCGTLTNRLLIKNFKLSTLLSIAFSVLFIAILLGLLFIFTTGITLTSLVLPTFIVGFANGFLFINALTCCLSYATKAGTLTALFTCAIMLIGALGTYIVSYAHVVHLRDLITIFGLSTAIAFVVFIFGFRKIADGA